MVVLIFIPRIVETKIIMRYRAERRRKRDLSIFIGGDEVNDFFIRELARKIVDDLPIAHLSKLINLVKIDPYSEESKEKLSDYKTSPEMKELIKRLMIEGTILYRAEINL